MSDWTFTSQAHGPATTLLSYTFSSGLSANVQVGDALFVYSAGGSGDNIRMRTLTTAGFAPIGGIQRGPYSNLSGWFGSLQVWYKEVTAPISSLAFTSNGGYYNVGWFNYRPPAATGLSIRVEAQEASGLVASPSPFTPPPMSVPDGSNVVCLLAPYGPSDCSVSSPGDGFYNWGGTNATIHIVRSFDAYIPVAGPVTFPTFQPIGSDTFNYKAWAFTDPVDGDHHWRLCSDGSEDSGSAPAGALTVKPGSGYYQESCFCEDT